MTQSWVVVLVDNQGIYGPFTDKDEAEEFASFLRVEVDPAAVVPLKSPTRELLAWRDTVKARGGGL